MLVRYYKGFLSYYAQHTSRVVQTVKCTPCIILHTSWIPGARVYDVGVFRVLDIYKYAQRLLEAAHCYFSTFTIPGFNIHPHSHKKGVKLNLISAMMTTIPDKLLYKQIFFFRCVSPQRCKVHLQFVCSNVQNTLFSLHSLDFFSVDQRLTSICLCLHLSSAVWFRVRFLPACDSDSISWLKLFCLLFLEAPIHKSSTHGCLYLLLQSALTWRMGS